MKGKKRIAAVMVMVLLMGMLAGCGTEDKKKEESAKNNLVQTEAVQTDEGEDIVLKYWTWFPSQDQLQETIDSFEAENPGIKVEMTVMEGLTFQEKVPLALQSGEDIDIIGVQPSDFAKTVEDYLVDLDELMPSVTGDNWLDGYSPDVLEKGKSLTDGKTKFITILNSGSNVGFYNAELLKEIGMDIPETIEEYKAVADALYAKYPDKYAGVFAGMEGWICGEMMLTILTQQGDYYNRWLYDNAPLNSGEYTQAMIGLKQYFDMGIFKQDIMDLDSASAAEAFINGDALVYFTGSWEAPLLSSVLREHNGIGLNDVGVMALPIVDKSGEPAVRAYLDCGIGIVASSKKQEAAAKFVQYLSTGKGVQVLSRQFLGVPGMLKVESAPDMLTSDAAREGWDRLVELMNHAPADRNNRTSWLPVIEGPCVQSVINGSITPEEAVEQLQKEWDTGNY